MCLGQPQTFLCSVANQGPSTHLEWMVEFKDSRSVPNVIHELFSDDVQNIRDTRNGISFVFNVISSSSSLESAMTVMVTDENGTALINNATVYCGQESDIRAVILVDKGD